jgi:hypothetical protein
MKKNKDELPPMGNADETDPLRAIGDIGAEYAKALHQIGIHQPSDLLRYTPEQLARELLEKAGKKVNLSRIRSKDWLGQARRLVEAQSSGLDAEVSAGPLEISSPARIEMAQAEGSKPAEWHERGMFTIKFLSREDPTVKQRWQILVYDEGGPGPEVPFEGLDGAPWSQWIIDRMKLDVAAEEEIQAISELPAAEQEITPIYTPVSQAQNPGVLEFAFNSVDVNRSAEDPENRLEVQAGFHLMGDGIDEVTRNRTQYRISFHLINLEFQTFSPISSIRGRLEPGLEAYQVRETFPIPEPGKYELHTTLILEESSTIFCDGPVFNVVQETSPQQEE